MQATSLSGVWTRFMLIQRGFFFMISSSCLVDDHQLHSFKFEITFRFIAFFQVPCNFIFFLKATGLEDVISGV
jgi:hypothetical protein